MATESTDTESFDVATDGGQKLFLLSLMAFSLIGAVGFSLFVFGAVSEFMATTTDRIITAGIGTGLMAICGIGVYATLR